MTVMQNMPDSKYKSICKILDIVLIVLYLAFFLLSFAPYSVRQADEVVDIRDIQYTMKEDDSYSIWGFIGFPTSHEWFKEYHLIGYNDGMFKYKVVNITDVGPALCLNLFALIFTVFLIIKNGNGRTFFGTIWGILGIWAFLMNRFLLTGNTWVRTVMFVIVIAALVVNLADFLLKHSDNRRKTQYLRSLSAVYK